MRTWRNLNSHTLLVGTYNSAAPVENSLKVPQKVKHKKDKGERHAGLHQSQHGLFSMFIGRLCSNYVI